MKISSIISIALAFGSLAGQSPDDCTNSTSEDSQQACEVVREFIEAVVQGDSAQADELRCRSMIWILGFEDDRDVIKGLRSSLSIRMPWPMSEERVEDLFKEGYLLTETGHAYSKSSYAKQGDMETIVSFKTDDDREELLWFHLRKDDADLWRIHSWQRYNMPYGHMIPLTLYID
jgi:hypothetical protein